MKGRIIYYLILSFLLSQTFVLGQSKKIKELQDELQSWEEYSFDQYVYTMDYNSIYNRLSNSGIISSITPLWSSYSNTRDYEYVFTPILASGYGATSRETTTVSKTYTQRDWENYKEEQKNNVFDKIDQQLMVEQLEKEKKQEIQELNRKRVDYIKSQHQIIEDLKDSLLVVFEDHYNLNLPWFEHLPTLNDKFIELNSKISKLSFFRRDHLVSKLLIDGVDYESLRISYPNGFSEVYPSYENTIIGFTKMKVFTNPIYFENQEYQRFGVRSNHVIYEINSLEKILVNLLSNYTRYGEDKTLPNSFLTLRKFQKMINPNIWNTLKNRLNDLHKPHEFYRDMNNKYSDNSFHSELYDWYSSARYQAESESYDFEIHSGVSGEKLEKIYKNLNRESNFYSSMINEVLEVGVIEDDGSFGDFIEMDIQRLNEYIESILDVYHIYTWIDSLKYKIISTYSSGYVSLDKREFKRIVEDLNENLSTEEMESYNSYISVFLTKPLNSKQSDLSEIQEFNLLTLEEYRMKIKEVLLIKKLIGLDFPIEKLIKILN
jgi:hypothetical protein